MPVYTDEAIDGSNVKLEADSGVIGAIPVIHTFAIPDAVSADYDIVLTHKTRVLDVIVEKRGGAGSASNTITVKNGATAITDAIDTNDADKVISRPSTIDDAQSIISAGGTLRVSSAKSGGNAQCNVTVIGVRVA